jgi:hypothetical protein
MTAPDPLDAFIEDPAAATTSWVQPIVGQLEQKIGTLQVEIARERVQRSLDADPMLSGRWRSLNQDSGFLAWLAEVDPMSAEVRMQMLHRAYNFGDTARVANFFRAYLAQQLPARARTQQRLPFEDSRPQPSVTETDLRPGRVWKRAEISRFYDDVRAGRYEGREGQRARIEAEIVAAARERRVLNPPI